jgi:hypothetical protein
MNGGREVDRLGRRKWPAMMFGRPIVGRVLEESRLTLTRSTTSRDVADVAGRAAPSGGEIIVDARGLVLGRLPQLPLLLVQSVGLLGEPSRLGIGVLLYAELVIVESPLALVELLRPASKFIERVVDLRWQCDG